MITRAGFKAPPLKGGASGGIEFARTIRPSPNLTPRTERSFDTGSRELSQGAARSDRVGGEVTRIGLSP